MSEWNQEALKHGIISADAEYWMNEEELLAAIPTMAARTEKALEIFGKRIAGIHSKIS